MSNEPIKQKIDQCKAIWKYAWKPGVYSLVMTLVCAGIIWLIMQFEPTGFARILLILVFACGIVAWAASFSFYFAIGISLGGVIFYFALLYLQRSSKVEVDLDKFLKNVLWAFLAFIVVVVFSFALITDEAVSIFGALMSGVLIAAIFYLLLHYPYKWLMYINNNNETFMEFLEGRRKFFKKLPWHMEEFRN